jgi:hypothetical protein
MMNERGKSDPVIVAVKPANKAEQSAAESVELKGGGHPKPCTKGGMARPLAARSFCASSQLWAAAHRTSLAISTLAANGCHNHRHGARISCQLDVIDARDHRHFRVCANSLHRRRKEFGVEQLVLLTHQDCDA